MLYCYFNACLIFKCLIALGACDFARAFAFALALAVCGCGPSLEPHFAMTLAACSCGPLLLFWLWLLTDAKNDNAAKLLYGQVVAAF